MYHLPKPYIFLFLLLLVTGQCSYGQIPGFFMKEEARRVVIPFLQSNNLIIVPVSINGGPAVNFLFDTGVKSNIFFNKTLADELGLEYTRKLNLMGADGRTILTASVSPNNHIDMGPVEGHVQAILVLEEDFLELEKVIGVPIFGVIGYEFFKFNPVKIDYDNSKMVFYRPDVFRWRPFGYRKMDFDFHGSKPYINTTIRQIDGPELDAKLLIDTGANHGLLLNMETSDDVVLPPVTISSDLGRSLGGDLFGQVGRVRRLNIGGLRFNKVITSYPDETEFSNIIIESGRKGSLGSDLLSRIKLIVDYPNQRIFFKKGRNYADDFEYDMSGLMVRVYSSEEKRFYISQVREDSPAAKEGVKLWDEIVSINKIPAFFWELADITKYFRSEEGKVITLELLRSNGQDLEEITVKFQLERQL